MKRLSILIVCLLLLVGCGTQPIEPDDDNRIILPALAGEYAVSVDFEPSQVRNYHGTYLGSFDIVEIGQQLIEKSKAHFSVNDYILQEGQVITNQRLGQLVRRESPQNPSGLNPASGSQFDMGNGVVLEDPVLVADVVEINFLNGSNTQSNLEGIGIAIVFNQVQRIETATSITTYEVSDDRMYEYASDVGRKLESYLRTLNQVGDIPIFIGLYSTKSVDASLPGNYIGGGYFVARSGQFTRLNEKWYIFPSNEVNTLDPAMSGFYEGLKQTLQTLLPESIGVIGKGRYINDQLDYLKVDVQMVAKTFMEIKATTQMAAAIIEQMENTGVHVVVEVTSLSKTVAIIEKAKNQSSVSITYINT